MKREKSLANLHQETWTIKAVWAVESIGGREGGIGFDRKMIGGVVESAESIFYPLVSIFCISLCILISFCNWKLGEQLPVFAFWRAVTETEN